MITSRNGQSADWSTNERLDRYMKYLIVAVVLLLSSGAFLNLVFDDNATNVTPYLHGDERLQLMWAIIDAAIIAVCFYHGRQLIRVASRQPLVLAFVVWGALSIAWSEDPSLSVRRVLGLICTTAFGFLLGMRFELKELMRMLAWTVAIVMVASVAAAVLFPSFGVMAGLDGGAWRGVFDQKNELGRLVGLGIVVFTCLLWESRRNRLFYLIPLSLGFALIVLSRSMTALIVTLVTLFLGLNLRLRLRPAQSVALFATVLLLGLPATIFLQGHMNSVYAFMGRDSTLTGRMPLWELSTTAVLHRPLLGAGWDVFWTSPDSDNIRSLIHWQAPHAHDAFIDISLNVGLIGLAIFLTGLFDCFRRAVRYSHEPGRPFIFWPLLFYSFVFFYMFTESSTVDRHSVFYILYCAISVSMNFPPRMEFVEDELEEEYAPAEMATNISSF
jgi:exopolysaccharide production protein ExoQ